MLFACVLQAMGLIEASRVACAGCCRLESALELCQSRKLHAETVFVLTRMGNARQALTLLLEHVGDVAQAIDFCQAQEDEELWEVLISHCLSQPKLVAPLLQDIGAHVDPLKVVKRIPKGMVIDGLKEKLIKIISDYHLQMSLKEGCEQILKSDVVGLEKRLDRVQRRASRIDSRTRCALTGAPVVGGEDSMLLWPYADLVVLHGGRVFQEPALVSLTQEQPASPSSGGGGGGSVGTGAWGTAAGAKGGGAGGAGGETGAPGGDGAAAARLLLEVGALACVSCLRGASPKSERADDGVLRVQKGFVAEGKHFYRDGMLHGRDW